jgi:hypothetical protein
MNRSGSVGRAVLVILLVAGCSSNRGHDPSLKEGAKDVGHTLGSAAREIGHGAKKVGKTIGQAAREGGRAFRDAVKSEEKE